MALEIRDRVKETCTGTDGDMTLTGAMSGFVGFDLDATLDGDTIYYALEDADGTKWEVGLGTLSADSTSIERTTILATQVSFTDTTRQTFSGGTHTIFATYPASKAVYLDASGNLSHTVDLTSEVTGTLPVANGGTNLTSLSTLLNSNVTPTSLSLVIGTNTQAWDAQLDTLAALTADQVGGLVDLATLEAPASDGQFIVATGAGAFAYESGATVRTSLGLGSIATLSSIDISANTNLAGGTGITLTGDTLSTTDSEIVHDNLSGFVANEHVNHTSVSIASGTGLSGGGDLTSTRTLSVDASQTQITAVGTLVGLTLDGDKNITPGDGSMIHLDTSTLTDNSTSGSSTAAKFASVAFEGPTLAATNSSVTTTDAATVYISAAPTAGTNQTLTNAWALWVDAGNVRLDGSLKLDSVLLSAVQTSAESFVDNDTSIMTSAAIQDKILSYSYSTTTGTVTSVAITGTDGIQVDSGSPITGSGTITLGLSGIANDKLANSSVSFGGVSLRRI